MPSLKHAGYRERVPLRVKASDPVKALEAAVIGGFHPSDFGYPEDGDMDSLKSLHDGLTVVACCVGERLDARRQQGVKRFLRKDLSSILEASLTDAYGQAVPEGTGERFLAKHKELLPDLVKDPHLAALPNLSYLDGYLEQSDMRVPAYPARGMAKGEAAYASQLFSEMREKGCIQGAYQEPGTEVCPDALSGEGLSGFVLETGQGTKALCAGKKGIGYGAVLLSGEGGAPVASRFVEGTLSDVSRGVRGMADGAAERQFAEDLRERHVEAPQVNEYAAKREGLSEAVCGPGKYMRQCRLYVEAAYPQLSKGLVYADIRAANDLALPGGYPSGNPALVTDYYTGEDGKRKQRNLAPYTVEEFDAINKAANPDGDKPVFYGDLLPRRGGFRVEPESISPSRVPFSMREHKARTSLAKMLNQQSKYLELEERSDLVKAFGLEKGAFGDLDIQSDVSPDMQYGVDAGDAAELAAEGMSLG